ncbi:MAG TPA: glycosyltransferase family A protein [Saprospiraceae bacterium]|nr:glycosyltransferase family A protein [Saprospiraceae bacterium]
MTEYPLVTNAIPLYRSERFVEIIIANIDAIEYPNVEIIISDRHQYDDAIDVLAAYFKDDLRVTILRAKDELTYAQHYNLLLSLGRGKYFRWMPHDDSYPVCCLKEKVAILETQPQYVLVCGPWQILDASGNVIAVHRPMKSKLDRWSYETSLFVAFGNYEGHAFKGLFRRAITVEKGIWLFDTRHIISPERCWEFAMSLLGEFFLYEDFVYLKRYYPGSTHDTWQRMWRPIDIFYTWYFKFRYQWSLDRKPMRILAFLVLMAPLTFRKILCDKTPQPWKKWVKAFPGRIVKHWSRLLLSKL